MLAPKHVTSRARPLTGLVKRNKSVLILNYLGREVDGTFEVLLHVVVTCGRTVVTSVIHSSVLVGR